MRLRPRLLRFALLALLAGPAAAQPLPLPAGVTGIGLIEGWRPDDGAHVSALEIRLAPGWYTYWRAPGLTGVPPRFDWSGSANLAAVDYEWPAPIVFDSFGSPTIGYKGALVLPMILTPERAAAPIEARVFVAFGVCREICTLAEARLAARLEPDAAPEGRAEIERALAERPLDADAAGVTAATCAVTPAAAGHALTAEITFSAPPGSGLTTVIEAGPRPDLWIGAAETRTKGQVVHATARLDWTGAGGLALDRGALRLTVLGARRAIDIRGCPGGK